MRLSPELPRIVSDPVPPMAFSITASISTTNSGRAKPLTTISVEAGGGSPTTASFGTAGTGSFQSNREVSFLASTSGGTPVPSGTKVRDLAVDYNGTLHKAISNNAATANADTWHLGGDFTNA